MSAASSVECYDDDECKEGANKLTIRNMAPLAPAKKTPRPHHIQYNPSVLYSLAVAAAALPADQVASQKVEKSHAFDILQKEIIRCIIEPKWPLCRQQRNTRPQL